MSAFVASPLAMFDAVYVLNLPDRRERLRGAREELAKIDAAAEARLEVVPGVRATEAHGFPSVGAYGCFVAHLNALRQARARGVECLLVLEDDVCFDPALWAREWPEVCSALTRVRWDVAMLGFGDGPTGPAEVLDGPLLRMTEPLMLAHCYAVRGEALAGLIGFLEEMMAREAGDPAGGPMHYDGALWHWARDVRGAVRVRPRVSMAGQRSSRSDIAGGRWFDRGPLRPFAELARRLKR